jgi:hypothetical protein
MGRLNILFENYCQSTEDGRFLDMYAPRVNACDDLYIEFMRAFKKINELKCLELVDVPIIVITNYCPERSRHSVHSMKLIFGIRYTFKDRKLDIEIGDYGNGVPYPIVEIPKSGSTINKKYWKFQERLRIQCYQERTKYIQTPFLDWFAKS